MCASYKHWSQHAPFLRYWPKLITKVQILTLKITFKINQHHYNLRTALGSPEKLHDTIHLGCTSILLINIEKYVKTSQT